MRYLRGTFRPRGAKTTVGAFWGRVFLCIVTLILMCALTLFSSLWVIFKSDCREIHKKVVDKAYENKYTEWIPSIYLSDDEIHLLRGTEVTK